MMRYPKVRGFSLVEVVVSIFVVGIILIASATLLNGVPLNRLTRDQDLALKIANNEIEALRALGYANLPASGSFADTELSSLTNGAGVATISDYNAKTKKIDVSVTWIDSDETPREISLTTLVTDVGGL